MADRDVCMSPVLARQFFVLFSGQGSETYIDYHKGFTGEKNE